MRIQLHAVPAILVGMIMFRFDVLAALEESLLRGPDELTVQAGFITAPTGEPALFAAPTWCGDPETGTRVLRQLTALGEPLAAQVGPTTMPDQLAQIDAMFPAGRHVEIGSRTVAGLDRPVRDVLLDAAGAKTSPLSAISLHSLHGAAARVPADATAFRNRTPHLMVETIAVWEPGDPAEDRHRAWVRGTDRLPGGYPNLLALGDTGRTAAVFGPNAERLRASKKRYDPDLVFHAREGSEVGGDMGWSTREIAQLSTAPANARRSGSRPSPSASARCAGPTGAKWQRRSRRVRACQHAGEVRTDVTADDLLLLVGFLWRINPDENVETRSSHLLDLVMDALRGGDPALSA